MAGWWWLEWLFNHPDQDDTGIKLNHLDRAITLVKPCHGPNDFNVPKIIQFYNCAHYNLTDNYCHIHITIYEWPKHKTSSIFNYIETNKAIDHERSTKDCWNDSRVDRITTYTTTLLIHQTWPSYCHTKSFSVRFLAITVLHTDEWTRGIAIARWYLSPTLSHQQQHNVT